MWPVFIPFGGCSGRCIYCAQDLQTGTGTQDLATILHGLRQNLEHSLPRKQSAPEIGFYGGTFTRLPHVWQRRFLALALEYKQRGLLTKIRCSTRPDAVDPEQIRDLRKLGLDLVELGIQSLDDRVLQASRRGYSSDKARRACKTVREQGLELGIQMMPGLPGQSPSDWQGEIREVCRLRPDSVRIYPCLVLEGTPLSGLWKRGFYLPWDTNRTIRAVSRATLRLWRKEIPVIRMGLPPEGTLLPSILAGPWHYALGNMVRSRILFYILFCYAMQGGKRPIRGLDCPRRYQGELWGHRGVNRRRLGKIDLSPQNVRYTEQSRFTLYFET
ncbi:MAG: radical SAM protein [Desulfohalobiaceae bacterium]|nr:radical SAM protein [Desulfohalobiaceae bacterium]